MGKAKSFFQAHSYRNTYILIGLVAAISYFFARELMNNMNAFGFINSSLLTFNIVIMFGLWGGLHSFIIKVKNPYLDKVILVFGFIFIVLVLRLLGMQTIFG
jgi:ABC-type proline/glycine betaine transport system permease subunit